MTEAEYQREKARVLKALKKWKKRLVKHWDVAYEFSEVIEDAKSGFATVMQCHAQWPYRKARISVALDNTQDMDDARLENSVVHEFLHAVINQMREYVPSNCPNCGSDRTVADGALKHEEAVVQNLADIILGVAAT